MIFHRQWSQLKRKMMFYPFRVLMQRSPLSENARTQKSHETLKHAPRVPNRNWLLSMINLSLFKCSCCTTKKEAAKSWIYHMYFYEDLKLFTPQQTASSGVMGYTTGTSADGTWKWYVVHTYSRSLSDTTTVWYCSMCQEMAHACCPSHTIAWAYCTSKQGCHALVL